MSIHLRPTALLAALLVAQAAHAATNDVQANFGVINPLPFSHSLANNFTATAPGVFTDSLGYTVSDATAVTTSSGTVYNFYDDYLFTMPSTGGTLTASAVSLSLGNIIGINNLQARLYSTANGLTTGAAPGIVSAWSTPTSVGGTTITMTSFGQPVTLVSGVTYALEVRGQVVGAGGNYGGSFLVQSAVPEASSGALALAGLSVAWLLASRRRKH